MLEINLVDKNHEALKSEAKDFDFSNPPYDPLELVESMTKLMKENGGMGISAPQVGIPYKVFVLIGNSSIGIPNYAIFNPIIVNYSDEQIILEEGCLSHKHTLIKIRRPIAIRCRFRTHTNNVMTERFTGLTSRAFQHEYDHLMGINYMDRANYFHKQKAKKDEKINKRRERTIKYELQN